MLRILAGLFGFVVVAGLVAFSYVAWHLTQGPMELAPAARIAERVVAEALGGGRRTSVARADLSASLSEGLAIRLTDVRVGEEGGGVEVVVPSAAIGLQLLPILTGDFRPSSLDLHRPRVVVDLPALDRERAERAAQAATVDPVTGTGDPASSAPPPEPAQPGPANGVQGPGPRGAALLEARLTELGKAVDRNLRLIRAEGLESLSVRQGELVVVRGDGQGGTKRTTIPQVEVSSVFGTSAGDIDLGFTAKGDIGRWSLRFRQIPGADGGRRILAEAADVTLKDLFGEQDPLLKADMPLYPTVDLAYDRSDRLVQARLDARVGAGILRFGKEPEDEILADEGQVVLGWVPAAGRVAIERAGLQVGPSALYLRGEATQPRAEGNGRWAIDLGLESGALAPRDVGGPAVAIQGFAAKAGFDEGRKVLLLDDLQIHFGGGALRSIGHVDFAQPNPLVSVNTVFTPVDAATIARVWPHFIAANARRWFIDHVKAGRVSDGLIKLRFPFGIDPPLWPADAVVLTARFDQTTTATFGDLPLVTEASGTLSMQRRRFEAVAERGVVATRHGRRPNLLAFRFDVPDAMIKGPRAGMEMRLAGENVALGEIIDAEPLLLLQAAGVKLEGLAGTGDVKGRVDLTFGKEFDPGSLDYRFEANLDKFGSPSPILGRRFQDAVLKVTVDRKGTTVTGKAKIDGVQTDVNMYEPSDKSNAAERRDFTMTLDDAARARMGLDLAGLVTGAVKVEIGQPPNGAAETKRITSDLTTARLVIPQFGWTKGAGVPAKAVLDVTEDDKGGTRIDNFAMDSEGLQVRGAMTVDKEKRLASADLSRFALRKGDDAKLKLVRGSDQVLNVTFEAGSFDLRSLLQSLKKQDGPEVDPKKQSDMSIKARAARLVGFNDVTLSDVVIDAQVRNQVVTRLQMTARAPGGRSIEISIRPDGTRRILTVSADDAGAALGFLDVYERLRGGTLQMAALLSGPGTADGSVRVVGFGLLPPKNERGSVLRTTPDGLREVAVRDVPVTEDATFDRFEVKFAMRKGVINVTEGIAKGPATGATMSGQIDLNAQRLQIAGTFIPLYGLNNLVSRIPIFGEIVGAGRNEGLVGVTFKVVGNVDNPVLQFNPISAIAPGIFRKIFEYRVDGGEPPPQAPVQ
ncbi:AsmA-like C-terminal domain-containing protein [Prosthecomicrobium sp. N25]|uniref:AsmA-like C-terminal domain-containing protein n=1 Tax=Prosthecomicrobium sp. N25 TaxID=3129254 RepID=UPI003077088F